MPSNPENDARERRGAKGSPQATEPGGVQGTPPERLDQLRERLRGLGYLDAPVDRYVLGSATSRAGSTRFALSAGLRVGIVAGVLLGISAAIALGARAPGFIASRRDAIVLAAGLSMLFALAAALAVAATVLAASWYARRSEGLTADRARVVAASAGIIVALGCAAYLTLWWNAAQSVFTGLTLTWNLAAIAIAAGVALLLAHAVSIVILAALVRTTSEVTIGAGGLLSSRGFLIGFGVILFAGSAALLATGLGGEREPESGGKLTVVPNGYAVRVLAIDGFDLRVSERLRESGQLRELSRLLGGARLPLKPEPGAAPDPARDWTTIATGQPPGLHGIASLESRRAVGIQGRLPAAIGGALQPLLHAADLLRLTTPAIASGAERKVPAFWEVASAAGLRTAVVNWWATWPAPAGDDIVISDRALLRLDTGGALDAEIAPASLYDPLLNRWLGIRSLASQAAAKHFAGIADPEIRRVLVRSAELDELVLRLSEALDRSALDLLVIYLPGLDIAQHHLLQTSAPASLSGMSERVAAIESYYVFLDGLAARILTPSTSHIDAAIVWPGRVGDREGALLLAGGPILSPAPPCDNCDSGAAGTLLYLLGVPVAANLKSTAVTSVVQQEFLRRHPLRRIATYDAPRLRRSGGTGAPLDAAALERLRSLGYIR